MNDRILPITDRIKGYLQRERLEKEKELYINSLFNKEPINIINLTQKEKANKRLQELSLIAKIKNLNNIWIYEKMVLEGNGYYLDYYSEIYQEALKVYNENYSKKLTTK